MTALLKPYTVCILWVNLFFSFSTVMAQKVDTVSIQLKPGEVLSMSYISADNDNQLKNAKLTMESYPIAILPKEVFMEACSMSFQRTGQIAELEQRVELLTKKEKLSEEEIKTLHALIEAYNKQLAACDGLNLQLNRSIETMKKNFDAAIVIAEKPLKKDFIKKAGIGLLGGAIGFSIASLLGAFK